MDRSGFTDNDTNPFDLVDEEQTPEFADEFARVCYVNNQESYVQLEQKRLSEFENLFPVDAGY